MSKAYKYEYAFFFAFYIIFSSFIFSVHEIVVAREFIGITVLALIYGLINSEIFGRADFGYYAYQAINIPILLVFLYFQFHINEFIK